MMSKSLAFDSSSIKKGPLLFVMILGAFIAVLNQTIMGVATAGADGRFQHCGVYGPMADNRLYVGKRGSYSDHGISNAAIYDP